MNKMKIIKTNLRFNLEKDADKKAYEFLQTIDKSTHKSVNRFVISLINDYADKKHIEQTEAKFIERIVSAIREELNRNPAFNLFQMFGQMQQSQVQMQTEQNTAENEADVKDFLNNFGGGN